MYLHIRLCLYGNQACQRWGLFVTFSPTLCRKTRLHVLYVSARGWIVQVLTLHPVRQALGFTTVSAMVCHNSDYLVNSISLNMRYVGVNPRATIVFHSMLQTCDLEILPYLQVRMLWLMTVQYRLCMYLVVEYSAIQVVYDHRVQYYAIQDVCGSVFRAVHARCVCTRYSTQCDKCDTVQKYI